MKKLLSLILLVGLLFVICGCPKDSGDAGAVTDEGVKMKEFNDKNAKDLPPGEGPGS